MTTINPPIADLCTHLRALYAGTPESLVHDLLDHIDAQAERIQEIGAVARQEHVRRKELEAQLEAIGAGGVEPLRKRGCLHHIEEPLVMVAR